MVKEVISSPVPVQAGSGSEPKEEQSLGDIDDVDVSQLVFLDDGDEAPRMHRRSQSMASMSSAAVDEEVRRSSSLTGKV